MLLNYSYIIRKEGNYYGKKIKNLRDYENKPRLEVITVNEFMLSNA